MKKKSFVRRLIPWVILAAAVACLAIFVFIPIYRPVECDVRQEPVVAYYQGDDTPLIMENEHLLFELDPATTHFTVTEKATGRVWHSNPEGAQQDPIALSGNKQVLESTLIVTYTNTAGVIDLNNYGYSIENGVYTIEQCEDGAIQVNYTIGDIERIYYIPQAFSAERYEAFLEKMPKSAASRIKSAYTKLDAAKVPTRDDAEELYAQYPTLKEQTLYVLKSSTKPSNKEKFEGYFADAGYTMEDYELDMQNVAAVHREATATYNVSIRYRLDGGDFIAEVPYDSIRYYDAFKITHLTVLPMFGAAGVDQQGFMVIPEGGGAIIRYNNGKTYATSYYANMYGWDYALERSEVVNETRCSYPVFGMTQGDGSFICILEGPTSYAGIQADISGRYNSYNWVNARYSVLHVDKYKVSAKIDQNVYMFEQEIPDACIVQRYRFIDSADYAVMANAYGDYLEANNPDMMNMGDASEAVPAAIEVVGAMNKTVERFGIPTDTTIPTTTFDEAGSMLTELSEAGIPNLHMVMTGWCNGGVNQQVLTKVNVLNELGGEKGMKALIATAEQAGVTLSFDGVNCFAYNSGVFEGFSTSGDAARFTTREQVLIYPYKVVTYQQAGALEGRQGFYLTRPQYAQDNADNLLSFLEEMGASAVSFRDIGYLLSADYDPNNTTTREETKALNVETLRQAQLNGQQVVMKKGNDYAAPYADLIIDMDLVGQDYIIIDAAVPFYQIALHGRKDYVGRSLNASGDYRTALLRAAETGAGIKFTFMNENTQILQDSVYSGYYGAWYEAWHERAIAEIKQYQADMAGLNQQRIIGHQVVNEYVSVTTYENGTRVYVNYGDVPAIADGVEINARSYMVWGGENQ